MDKEKTVSKNTKIEINVGLNDKDVPLHIEWKSDDNPNADDSPQMAKAMLLSMFFYAYYTRCADRRVFAMAGESTPILAPSPAAGRLLGLSRASKNQKGQSYY